MDGKRIILYKQSWKAWLEVLINYTKGSFMETLVNALSFWLTLEQILVTCYLKVRSLSILTPNNTSSLLGFIVDPIIFSGLSTNGLSKNIFLDWL